MLIAGQHRTDIAGRACPAARGLGRLLGAIAVIHIAVFAIVAWLTMIRAPSANMLDWLDAYWQYRQDGHVWAYLLQFFQEHRLVWMRLLAAADASGLQSSGMPFIFVGLLALLGVAAWLTVIFRSGMAGSGADRALAWLCPMLVLVTANAMDCSIPVNIVYPLTLLFVVAACALFDSPGGSDASAACRRWLAVVMAGAAGLANAVGLLAWPVLLWAAWASRTGWRWLLVLAILSAAYGAAYVHGMVPTGGLVPPPESPVEHAIKRAAYLLAYLSLPVSRLPGVPQVKLAVGVGLLLAGLGSVAYVGFRRRSASRLERISSCMILFAIASAALAAFGRADFAGTVDVPLRYTVLVTPLHVGLLGIALAASMRAPHLRQRPVPPLLCGVAVAAVLLFQQVLLGRHEVDVAASVRRTVAQFYDGARDPATEQIVYPGAIETADAIVARLRRAGLLDW